MGRLWRSIRIGMLVLVTLALLAQPVTWQTAGQQAKQAAAPVSLKDRPIVALTFDDGPRAGTTDQLLDGLAQRGIHATFFIIGMKMEDNEDLLVRMEVEGHQVGIHSNHHKILSGLNGADFVEEVDNLKDRMKDLLGREDFMLRPPYGMLNTTVQNRASSPIILWSVDPRDWEDHDTARQVKHVMDNVRDGDIILLHDIYPSSVETALEVVDKLMAQGFYFVTVEELFALRGIEPENGKVYQKLPPQE